jgi:hypothetical protein
MITCMRVIGAEYPGCPDGDYRKILTRICSIPHLHVVTNRLDLSSSLVNTCLTSALHVGIHMKARGASITIGVSVTNGKTSMERLNTRDDDWRRTICMQV